MPLFRKKPKPGPPQWLIVGLGNPGLKYQYNRHNAGFLCIDVLANKLGIRADKLKFRALFELCEIAGQRCVLMKPQTYMNESGRAVAECVRFYQLPAEHVLVISDDISFDVGALRIRRKGSDGGQKGLRSIAAHLGTEDFPRIKLGVGQKPHADYDTADWVLSDFGSDELKIIREACERTCEAIELIVQDKMEEAMGKFSK